jgi:hypothetical protein
MRGLSKRSARTDAILLCVVPNKLRRTRRNRDRRLIIRWICAKQKVAKNCPENIDTSEIRRDNLIYLSWAETFGRR